MAEAGEDIAEIFASPFKPDAFQYQALLEPADARRVRELCNANGAKLIVDGPRGNGPPR